MGSPVIPREKDNVVYIDSDSGHYPSTKVFDNVLKELAACGVDVKSLGARP